MLRAQSHCLVVLDAQIFERLHESSLHVATLGSLYSCVYQTFPATDRMEEELRSRKAAVKTILDESFGCRLL